MELEHRFELPVDADTAFATLLDMRKVGTCFPGATLDSVDGDDFAGSVKIKFGPVQLTYKGNATITDRDPVARRARIEAVGAAARSSSTAALLVTAIATPVSPNRTAVDLVTTLSMTGRPAQFGRDVMVEVGNKLISQFADCVSTKLVGRAAGGAELVDVFNPDEVAAEMTADPVEGPVVPVPLRVAPPASAPGAPPVDLLAAAGRPALARVAPVLLGVVLILLLRRLLRRRS